jgi:hypothetical protein
MVMGQLEVRPAESIALAAGRPLNLSVREFALLVDRTAKGSDRARSSSHRCGHDAAGR